MLLVGGGAASREANEMRMACLSSTAAAANDGRRRGGRGGDANVNADNGDDDDNDASGGSAVDWLRALQLVQQHGPRVANLSFFMLDFATPLHLAVACAKPSYIRLLAHRGADVNKTNDRLRTPLMEAARAGHADCIVALRDWHADPDIPDQFGIRPLHVAAMHPDIRVAEALLLRTRRRQWPPMQPRRHYDAATPDLDLDAVDGEGATPLMWAARNARRETILLLLACGARPDVKDVYNEDAAQHAESAGDTLTAVQLRARVHLQLAHIQQHHQLAGSQQQHKQHQQETSL